MAILELKAEHGWSGTQTARSFLVDEDTTTGLRNLNKQMRVHSRIESGEDIFPREVYRRRFGSLLGIDEAEMLAATSEDFARLDRPVEPTVIEHSDGRVLDLPLEGIVDAIVRFPDGQHAVIDPKTARSAYTATEIELDLQSTCYSYAARQLGFEGAGFQLQVMSKSRKSPKLSAVDIPRGEDAFDRLCWICANALRLIQPGVFLPAAPGWHCNACEYRRWCATVHQTAYRTAEVTGTAAT